MNVKFLQTIFLIFLLHGCELTDKFQPDDFDPKKIQKVVFKKEKISPRGKKNYRLNDKYYRVDKYRDDFHQRGLASWYVGNHSDSVTAINEVYDPHLLTAAHKTLPLPCYVKVTNLNNGRSIIVRVNDRGPFVSNRILDVSYAAAYKLGMLKKGLTHVQIDTLNHGEEINIPMTSIKYGPFKSLKVKNNLNKHFKNKTSLITDSDNDQYFLVIGPFDSQIKLDRARAYLRNLNDKHAKLRTIRSTNVKKVA